MKKLPVVVGLLMAALGLAAQAQLGSAMAAAPYSEAKDFVYLLASGSFGRAAQMVDEGHQVVHTPKSLEAGWTALLEKYGRFQALEVSGADLSGDRWTIHVVCTFERGRVDVALDFNSITNQGKVTGVTYSKLGENERL